MVFMEKQVIKTEYSESEGWVSVTGEGSESSADVYVQTAEFGVSLSKAQAFDLIVLLCEGAGLQLDRTGLDGLIIQKPENPAIAKRRDELASVFAGYDKKFDVCPPPLKRAINYIVDGELEAGRFK